MYLPGPGIRSDIIAASSLSVILSSFLKKKFLYLLVILTVSYQHDHRQEMGGQLCSLESSGEVKVLTFQVFCFSTQYFKMVRIAFLINIAH